MKKRKQYLIYKEFQLKIVFLNFIVTTASFLAFAALVYLSFEDISSVISSGGIPANHPIFKFINFQKSELLKRTLILSLIFSFLMMAFNIFLSHRISGPIVRLIAYLRQIRGGEKASKLQFRENDYFKDLSYEVNEVLTQKSIITDQSGPHETKKIGA
jgi:sensor histidine kinase YesM